MKLNSHDSKYLISPYNIKHCQADTDEKKRALSISVNYLDVKSHN